MLALNVDVCQHLDPACQSYNTTCLTSKEDSDQPVHPSSMARVLVYLSLVSLKAVEKARHTHT